jgi:cbb3-type cytochrome oxidase maturation protein
MGCRTADGCQFSCSRGECQSALRRIALMEIIYLLIGISVLLIGLIAWAFWWAVGAGQFEDLERAGAEILREED